MARSERAAGLIPFIIMLVLFLVALGWGYLNYSKIHNTETGLDAEVLKLKIQNKKFQEEAGQRRGFLRAAAEVTGYSINKVVTGQVELDAKETSVEKKRMVPYGADMTMDAPKMAEDLKARLAKWVKDYRIDYTNYRFSADGDEIKADPDGTKVVDYFFLPEGLAKDYTWRVMPERFEAAMNLMKAHILGLARELDVAREHIETAAATTSQMSDDKDRVAAELRSEKATLEQRYESEIGTLRERVNVLDGRVREAEAAKLQVEEEATKQKQDDANRILALEQNIKRMKTKIEIERAPTPDGEVLASSSITGIAVVNRGKKDNLKPGTVFEVYNFAKGGVKRAKGYIKVLDVKDTSAKCRILRQAGGDPIVEGDLIANELYNPGKTLHFFILGKLAKYGVTEATALLEKLGNKVDSKITVDTDYLLLGSKASESDGELEDTPEYKKAKELGLKVITERDLEAFTKY